MTAVITILIFLTPYVQLILDVIEITLVAIHFICMMIKLNTIMNKITVKKVSYNAIKSFIAPYSENIK